MQCPFRRLLILLCALMTFGFGAGILALHPWTRDSGSINTATITPARSSAGNASDDRLRSVALRANPAAQKAGPPDPKAVKTAARSAEDAARAAADLAGTDR